MSQRLIHLLPPYYASSKISAGILGAGERESDALVAFARDAFRQGNPLMATWGLDQWERDLYLSPAPAGSSHAARRARILPRLAAPPLITPEEMGRIAGQFTPSGWAEIAEYGREMRFEIIADLSAPFDHCSMYETVYEMRPKHLSFSITTSGGGGAVEVIGGGVGTTVVYTAQPRICGAYTCGGGVEL